MLVLYLWQSYTTSIWDDSSLQILLYNVFDRYIAWCRCTRKFIKYGIKNTKNFANYSLRFKRIWIGPEDRTVECVCVCLSTRYLQVLDTNIQQYTQIYTIAQLILYPIDYHHVHTPPAICIGIFSCGDLNPKRCSTMYARSEHPASCVREYKFSSSGPRVWVYEWCAPYIEYL